MVGVTPLHVWIIYITDCSDNGWIDTLLPSTYSNENTIDLPTAKGATTILECTPNTTLSNPFTTWLRNNNATLDANYIKLPNGGLLVREFDPPAEGVVTFRCIVISSSCSQMTREFNLRMSDGESVCKLCWHVFITARLIFLADVLYDNVIKAQVFRVLSFSLIVVSSKS